MLQSSLLSFSETESKMLRVIMSKELSHAAGAVFTRLRRGFGGQAAQGYRFADDVVKIG